MCEFSWREPPLERCWKRWWRKTINFSRGSHNVRTGKMNVPFLMQGFFSKSPEPKMDALQWWESTSTRHLKLTASLHLKMDGWNTFSFPFGMAYFQGRTVSFRECKTACSSDGWMMHSKPCLFNLYLSRLRWKAVNLKPIIVEFFRSIGPPEKTWDLGNL